MGCLAFEIGGFLPIAANDNLASPILRKYIHSTRDDDPQVWLEGAATFNPRNGQMGLGFDLHVGAGVGGGAKLSGSKSGSWTDANAVNPILDVNFFAYGNLNVLVGAGYSKNLFGTSPGQVTKSLSAGPNFGANVNIGVSAALNGSKLYDLKCKK